MENAAHLALRGHFAHAAPAGDSHETDGGEHDCSGTVHVCSCCLTLAFVPGERFVPPTAHIASCRIGTDAVRGGSVPSRSLFRPPRV
ncbi:MAG: hypothetical protein Kow0062_20890 [Acidobacteriota bacterium]